MRLAKFKGLPKHTFHLHLKETEWRYNHRASDKPKMLPRYDMYSMQDFAGHDHGCHFDRNLALDQKQGPQARPQITPAHSVPPKETVFRGALHVARTYAADTPC